MPADQDSARKRGRPRTSAETVEVRRQKLVEAAFEVSLEKGYQATGIADVTARAGFGFSTFYKSFESKREILDAVIDYGVDQLLGEVLADAQAAAQTADEFETQLRSIMVRIYDVCQAKPELARFLVLEANAIDEEMSRRWFGLIDLGVSVAEGYLAHAVGQGFVREDVDTTQAARAMLGVILMGMVTIASGTARSEDVDGYVDTAMQLLAGAMRTEEA